MSTPALRGETLLSSRVQKECRRILVCLFFWKDFDKSSFSRWVGCRLSIIGYQHAWMTVLRCNCARWWGSNLVIPRALNAVLSSIKKRYCQIFQHPTLYIGPAMSQTHVSDKACRSTSHHIFRIVISVLVIPCFRGAAQATAILTQ
jgi:hypothetical protein